MEVGPGEISFLYEKWTGLGCSAREFPNLPSETKLKDVVENDFNIEEGMDDQLEAIRARYLLVHTGAEEDKRI